MNNYLNRHKQTITRQILAVFVISWFSLIGQANAHSLMMAEMQQHKGMGHEMPSHCQPVLCEAVISLDDQISYGLSSVSLLDFNDLPVLAVSVLKQLQVDNSTQRVQLLSVVKFEPPPLQRTSILQI